MTRPPSRPPARPRVRPVKVRPPGHDTDVRLVAELPAEHLPTATADRVQVGEPSPAYSNRRVGGSRRNAEVYVLDHAVHPTRAAHASNVCASIRWMDEYPAVVKHAGLPRRPTEVRRVDTGMTCRVVEVRAVRKDVEYRGRAAETVYRLLVFGPMPYRPGSDGQFEMIAVNYRNRPYWWVRPSFGEAGDS